MGQRVCGGCTACCKVMAIKDFKEGFRVCRHSIKGKGCGIYESRPAPCREFICGWLGGWGTDQDRPDKIGVVFIPNDEGTAVKAMEVFPGGSAGPRAQAVIAAALGHYPVVIVRENGQVTELTVKGKRA